MQGPEPFLAAQTLAFRCPVDTTRGAVLEPRTRVVLNHDIFYCADKAAARRLRAAPVRYVHTLGDPVTHARFALTARSPHTRYQKRDYYFASATTRRTFAAHPDSFAVRRAEAMR